MEQTCFPLMWSLQSAQHDSIFFDATDAAASGSCISSVRAPKHPMASLDLQRPSASLAAQLPLEQQKPNAAPIDEVSVLRQLLEQDQKEEISEPAPSQGTERGSARGQEELLAQPSSKQHKPNVAPIDEVSVLRQLLEQDRKEEISEPTLSHQTQPGADCAGGQEETKEVGKTLSSALSMPLELDNNGFVASLLAALQAENAAAPRP